MIENFNVDIQVFAFQLTDEQLRRFGVANDASDVRKLVDILADCVVVGIWFHGETKVYCFDKSFGQIFVENDVSADDGV